MISSATPAAPSALDALLSLLALLDEIARAVDEETENRVRPLRQAVAALHSMVLALERCAAAAGHVLDREAERLDAITSAEDWLAAAEAWAPPRTARDIPRRTATDMPAPARAVTPARHLRPATPAYPRLRAMQ